MPDTAPNPSGMFPNPILTSIVLGRPADQPYVVDRFLPVIPSPFMTFDIAKVGKDTNMYEEDDFRAINGESNEIAFSDGAKVPGRTIERSLKTIVDDVTVEQSRRIGDFFRVSGVMTPLTTPEVVAAVFVRDRILKGREVRGARVVISPANYDSSLVAPPGFNVATDDIEAEVRAKRLLIKRASNVLPNRLGMSFEVWQTVQMNPVLRQRILGVYGGMLTEEQVARMLGVEELVIGNSTYDTNSGGTVTHHDVWPNFMNLMYVPSQPASGTRMFGATYTTPYEGAAAGGEAQLLPGYGGTPGQTQLGMHFQERITENRTSYFYKERYSHEPIDGTVAALWPSVATHP